MGGVGRGGRAWRIKRVKGWCLPTGVERRWVTKPKSRDEGLVMVSKGGAGGSES